MGRYVPQSTADQKKMLELLGLKSTDELYAEVPDAVKLKRELNIPAGKSELEVRKFISELAGMNKIFPTIFRGAGAYRHYVPAIVGAVVSKETLVTAYTPYQPEVSQGVLQSIFEYETMICELTGMDASNASVYDAATACAEAVTMCTDKKRNVAYVSATLHPDYIKTVQTYCFAAGREVVVVPAKDGVTDIDSLKKNMKESCSCLIIQQPNFYGLLEDADALGKAAKDAGAKFVMCVNPIYAAIGKTPREHGADIAVGDGQPLGLGLSFGGPYLGFMACTKDMARKLPGRVIGQTVDLEGKRGFVMTMQAREQHIRREMAASGICSNQALCAMAAACYMGAMGPAGMKQAAEQCLSKAHYMAKNISAVPGFELVYKGEFFHEFVTKCPFDPDKLMQKLENNNILGGYVLKDKTILWCCTEMNTKAEIDTLVGILKGGI
jgi:glycine dehydrogenase subunit 1